MQQKQQATVILGGGIDIVSSPLKVDPGKLLRAKNFECDVAGGYKLMQGYERFDGNPEPSKQLFSTIALDQVTGFLVTDVITGSTSAATAIVIDVVAEGLSVVDINGVFVEGETITSTGGTGVATSGTFEGATLSDAQDFRDLRFKGEEHFRALISAVPGVGPVRGVLRHEEFTIACRDFDVTEGRIYRATASGWVRIREDHIVFFNNRTNKNASSPEAPITVNDGNGNSATLVRTVWLDASEMEGYIILSGYTIGFQIGDTIKETTVSLATVTEAAVAIKLEPGGHYEFRSYNFTGAELWFNIYGCDGANPAFEYWPAEDTYVPLYTDQLNRASDIPSTIGVYRNHLFFGFSRGILRNSEPNDPTLWDAAAGSLEIPTGSAVTGIDETAASLVVTTRRQTFQLLGDIKENFALKVASSNTGAIAHTIQHLGTTFMVDDRGIIELRRVEAFGNFENATISRVISPILDRLRPSIATSVVSLSKNIYRLITSDGKGISMTFEVDNVVSFSEFDLDVGVFCASNAEDASGAERIFLGSTDGYVYEMDAGRSFDGAARESWVRVVHHFLNSHNLRKRFFRMFADVAIDGEAQFEMFAEYSAGAVDVNQTASVASGVAGIIGGYDLGAYDRAVYDAGGVSESYMDLQGTGDAIGIIIYHLSAIDDIFAIKDLTYHFKRRRLQRGAR